MTGKEAISLNRIYESAVNTLKAEDCHKLLDHSRILLYMLRGITQNPLGNQKQLLLNVVHEICLPYLTRKERKVVNDAVQSAMIDLIIECCFQEAAVSHSVVLFCLHCLDNVNSIDRSFETTLSLGNVVQVLILLFKGHIIGSEIHSQIISKSLILFANENTTDNEFSCMVRLLSNCFKKPTDEDIILFWSTIDTLHRAELYKRLFMLLAIHLPVIAESNVVQTEEFWIILQKGLINGDPLTRKRALFCVKCLVDLVSKKSQHSQTVIRMSFLYWSASCNEQLWSIWKTLLIVFETLEEKQIHVIEPVLPSFNELLIATYHDKSGGSPLLHHSWFFGILKRAFMHESKQLVKWSLQYCLQLDLGKLYLPSDEIFDFIIQTVLETLRQSFLYHKEDNIEIGGAPSIVKYLKLFFKHYFHELDGERQKVLLRLILGWVSNTVISPYTAIYVTESLEDIILKDSIKNEDLLFLLKFLQSNETKLRVELQLVSCHSIVTIWRNNADFKVVEFTKVAKLLIQVFNVSINNSKNLTLLLNFVNSCTEFIVALREYCIKQIDLFNSGTDQLQKKLDETFFLLMLCLYLDRDSQFCSKMKTFLNDTLTRMQQSPYFSNDKALIMLNCFKTQILFVKEYLYSGYMEIDRLVQVNTEFLDSFFSKLSLYFMFVFDTEVKNEDLRLLRKSLDIIEELILIYKSSKNLKNEKFIGAVYNVLVGFLDKMKNKLFLAIKNMCEIKRYIDMFTLMKLFSYVAQMNVVTKDFVLLIRETISEYILHFDRKIAFNDLKAISVITCDEFIESCWFSLILCFDITGIKEYSCNTQLLYESFQSDVDLMTNLSLIRMVNFSKIFIELFEKDTEKLLDLQNFLWNTAKGQRQADNFRIVIEECIGIIFHNNYLLSSNEKIQNRTKIIWQELYEIGSIKPGVVNVAMKQLITIWKDVDNKPVLQSMMQFVPDLMNVITFGSLNKKDRKANDDMIDYLQTHFEFEDFQSLHSRDQNVRVMFINFVLNLKTNGFSEIFMQKVLYLLLEFEKSISSDKHAYYPNSELHRHKIRIWQMVLVIISKIFTNTLSADIVKKMFLALHYDNQPSVRRLIEWNVVLLFLQNKKLLGILWEYFETANEKKIITVTSVLSISCTLIRILEAEEFIEFIKMAIPLIVPWTQGQHMTSRIHAQIALENAWLKLQKHEHQKFLNDFSWLKYFFTLEERNSAAVKHKNEALQNFFYAVFHPVKHYSLESIFHGVLSNTEVAQDESILVEKFHFDENLTDVCRKVSLRKYNWDSKSVLKIGSGEGVVLSVPENSQLIDLQKKIMPWNLLPSADDTSLRSELDKKDEASLSDLIVCAVLVDKIPNLGGLCRTSEIFGAGKLIIGSYRYLSESGFKSLSVSSEKWVNIEQVIPKKLSHYLEEKKTEGYHIVGVEQTANSKMISDYKFPKRTLLVLGNERTGIPVDIIQLMDDCVEIPQVGIIRSLNVHISGSIMIWEYCKQHIFK